MNEVSGRACAVSRASRREGRSHADAARANTNRPTTRVRERAAMARPSCHGRNLPTASLRAMGPEDLPSLLAGSAEVVPAEELERKLSLGRPLRVKLGLAPTVPVGGVCTQQVGDPPGKTETRPRLSEEEVRGYPERLLDQFWKILDPDRTEVRYNAEWLRPMGKGGVRAP